MRNIHEHYEQLSEAQRAFVDDAFRTIFKLAKARGIVLYGDDRAELAVDALAKLLEESQEDMVRRATNAFVQEALNEAGAFIWRGTRFTQPGK